MTQITHFYQNFFDEDIGPITATTVRLSQLTEELLQPFLENQSEPIGIAPAYATSSGQLVVLAIANESNVLLVEFYSKSSANRDGSFQPSKNHDSTGRTLLQEKLLYRPFGSIFAFDFEPLVLSLYKDHGGLRLINGVDIQSACSPGDRQPIASIKAAVGEDTTIYEENIYDSFENMVYDPKRTSVIALRAWLSQYLPRLGTMKGVFAEARRIDTRKIQGVTLELLAKISRDAQRLDQEKPTQVTRKVDAKWDEGKGQMTIGVDRYRNKMRASKEQLEDHSASLNAHSLPVFTSTRFPAQFHMQELPIYSSTSLINEIHRRDSKLESWNGETRNQQPWFPAPKAHSFPASLLSANALFPSLQEVASQPKGGAIPELSPEPQSYWIDLHPIDDLDNGIPELAPEPMSLSLELYPMEDAGSSIPEVSLDGAGITVDLRSQKEQHVRVHVGDNPGTGHVLPVMVATAASGDADVEVQNMTGTHLHTNKVAGQVTITGREEAINAEKERGRTILRVLEGNTSLLANNPWIQKIHFPSDDFSWPLEFTSKSSLPDPDFSILACVPNASQLQAVEQMLSSSDDSRITIIHGPPGTGKTTVIISYVLLAVGRGEKGIWLTAQSNVAVKNIAEKLFDADFKAWKLLVSKDFIEDWHEHLYPKIAGHVIVSDRMGAFNLQKELCGCNVILSTLSMLSSPKIGRVTSYNPFTTLVIDEASQIELGDYMAVFTKYASSLCKVCFIGDDKQLPPFANENIETLQSIFEVVHLRDSAIFLDTQYRMPPYIGDFISKSVYSGELQSNPLHPITNKTISCYFIDVADGKQKADGVSLKNLAELEAVLQIAEQLQVQGKSFRIITPYDAMCTAIEAALKENGLIGSGRVFDVDSFQGNEDDYIVISVVRSSDLGFLKSLRRTNVMLTRCKRGMFICSSRAFLEGDGKKSLMGKMAAEFGERSWVNMANLEEVLLEL